MKRLALFFIVIALLLLPLGFLGSKQASGAFPDDWFYERSADHAKIEGKPAPALDLTNWKNGTATSAELKGKILVLDIWATWCGPCIQGLPDTDKLAARFKDQGVTVIAVCGSGFEEGAYEKILAQTQYKGLAAIPKDPDKFIKDWAVIWWPTYAVVDRNGIVRAVGLSPEGVEKVVEKLLAEVHEKKSANSEDESEGEMKAKTPEQMSKSPGIAMPGL